MRSRTVGRRAVLLSPLALAIVLVPRLASAGPRFAELANALPNPPCAGASLGCWTNHLRVTDIDADGDLDVLFANVGDYFGQGREAQPFAVYLNDGHAGFSNQSSAVVGGLTKSLRQVAVGDVNGDGLPDMYLPDAFGGADVLFIGKGGAAFADEAAARLPGMRSHAGAARFGDVDSDGDLDLVVADGYGTHAGVVAHLYLNDGTGSFTEHPEQLPAIGTVESTSSPDFAVSPDDFDWLDVDRDFDLDLLVNMHQGRELLFVNDGTGTFTDASAGVARPAGDYNKYGPGVCDVDGDGDLDVWIDNSATEMMEQLLINDGSGKLSDETASRVQGNVPMADDNGVVCADVDHDGDFDAVIASLSDNERVLLNDGHGHFTALAGVFPAIQDSTLWMELGDLDGDGRLDAVTGQGESGSFLDRVYLSAPEAPVDTTPPKIISVEQAGAAQVGDAPVVRFAVSDATVTDEGPRLARAWVKVTRGTVTTEAPATFMGGDLFRAQLGAETAGGMVSYQACARDPHGNEACADALSYAVAGATAAGGGAAARSGGGCTVARVRGGDFAIGAGASALAAALARRARRARRQRPN